MSVAFSPCGSTIASGSGDYLLMLWECKAPFATKATLRGHTGAVLSVAFSPCGSTIASGSDDHLLMLWDAATGALRAPLKGHRFGVNTVAFSPCGATIATGSADSSIKLWDAETGTLKTTLKGHTSYVESVAFSPCGSTLATAGDDSAIHLWAAPGTGSTYRLTCTLRRERSAGRGNYARSPWRARACLVFSPGSVTRTAALACVAELARFLGPDVAEVVVRFMCGAGALTGLAAEVLKGREVETRRGQEEGPGEDEEVSDDAEKSVLGGLFG